MFGTLVIQLPSNYSGGELTVHHRSKEESFNFSGTGGCTNFFYAAFYADCQHELKPVTKGYRLCLVYNLVYQGSGDSPVPADNEESVSTVVSAMRRWSEDGNSINPLIAYVLEHQYCEASLSFQSLKNGDRAVADVLARAQEEVYFDMFVANVNLSQNWSALHYSSYYGGEDYSAEELIEEALSANSLKAPDGKTICRIDIDSEYLVPKDFFDGMDPDEESFEEATGNEGATVDKQYNWAALIFWPSGHRLKNIGIASTVALLKQHSFDALDLHKKAGMENLMRELICACGAPEYKNVSSEVYVSLLQSIQCLGKVEMVAELLQVISTSLQNHRKLMECPSFSDEIIAIGSNHGWSMLAPSLQAIFDKLSPSNCRIESYCQFVHKILQPSSVKKDLCIGLASSIVSALVSEPDGQPSTPMAYNNNVRGKDFIVKLFDCLVALECNDQLLCLVHAISKKPKKYPVLEVLAPICEDLSRNARLVGNKAYKELVSFCISSLESSSSCVLSSPSHWSEPVKFSCSCTDCTSLMSFLRNPIQKQERYKMNQSRRFHIHQQLNGYGCSVTHVTERVGSPHTLVVTKTRAKYEKKCERLQKDKSTLSRLQALVGGSPQPPAKKRSKID